MCSIKYDRVGDVLQILEKRYNAKKVDFFKLFPDDEDAGPARSKKPSPLKSAATRSSG